MRSWLINISNPIGGFMRGISKRQLAHACRTTIEAFEPRRLLSTFTVNTTSDVINALDGVTTLREAVTAANNHSGTDSIAFSSSVFTAGSLHTIKLTNGAVAFNTDSAQTTIAGPGPGVLAVDGNLQDRVFITTSNVKVSITGMKIVRGRVAPISPTT